MRLDDSIIILFYLEQQHSTLQQAQSQLQLQGFPFSHPLQEHSPLQHLQSISQHGSLLLFIILPKIFHQIYPTLHKQKSPREEAGCYLILYTALLINPFTHSFSSESPNISNRA